MEMNEAAGVPAGDSLYPVSETCSVSEPNEVAETHTGLVFLVGDRAYKVKKPVVTDFLDFKYWPAFNLADSFIVIGVGIILIALVHADRG